MTLISSEQMGQQNSLQTSDTRSVQESAFEPTAELLREVREESVSAGTGVNISREEFQKLKDSGLFPDLSFDDLNSDGNSVINEYDVGKGSEHHNERHYIRTGEWKEGSVSVASSNSNTNTDTNTAELLREIRVASDKAGTGVTVSREEFQELKNSGLFTDLSFNELDTDGNSKINAYDVGRGKEHHHERHYIRTGEWKSSSGTGDKSTSSSNSGSSTGSSTSSDRMEVKWGGEDVDIWDITKDNATDSGVTDGATVFLVTVNDTSLSGVKSLAEKRGYEVVETDGKSDAGVLLLRPKENGTPDGFEDILDYGKVTVTAVKEPEGKRLEPNGGGFETRPNDGMGFGTTDNTSTKGEFFKTTGGNSKIERNREDDGRLWHSGDDMKKFRGGWMGLEWD